MTELAWRVVAWVVTRGPIKRAIIARAKRTPYTHLPGYMDRWWLFNPYPKEHGERQSPYPSARIHHIKRADRERHLHDHPWDARTIILDGWYLEERADGLFHCREEGDTASLKYGEYHRIVDMGPRGATTLFITWRYRGTWGVNVDRVKIRYRAYLRKTDAQS